MTQKAKRGLIYLGHLPLDVYQMPDGQYEMYTTSIEEVVDKKQRYHLRRFLAGKSPEALESQGFQLDSVKPIWVERGGLPIKPIPPHVAIAYWKWEARQGNEKARQLLENLGKNPIPPFEEYGGTYIFYGQIKKKGIKRLEAECVERLKTQTCGVTEVPTPDGNIDLLTSTELIEVKEVKAWKCAIGQVEIYGDYYPSHEKRIHLFGTTHSDYLKLIESHCGKRNIRLTWEV